MYDEMRKQERQKLNLIRNPGCKEIKEDRKTYVIEDIKLKELHPTELPYEEYGYYLDYSTPNLFEGAKVVEPEGMVKTERLHRLRGNIYCTLDGERQCLIEEYTEVVIPERILKVLNIPHFKCIELERELEQQSLVSKKYLTGKQKLTKDLNEMENKLAKIKESSEIKEEKLVNLNWFGRLQWLFFPRKLEVILNGKEK